MSDLCSLFSSCLGRTRAEGEIDAELRSHCRYFENPTLKPPPPAPSGLPLPNLPFEVIADIFARPEAEFTPRSLFKMVAGHRGLYSHRFVNEVIESDVVWRRFSPSCAAVRISPQHGPSEIYGMDQATVRVDQEPLSIEAVSRHWQPVEEPRHGLSSAWKSRFEAASAEDRKTLSDYYKLIDLSAMKAPIKQQIKLRPRWTLQSVVDRQDQAGPSQQIRRRPQQVSSAFRDRPLAFDLTLGFLRAASVYYRCRRELGSQYEVFEKFVDSIIYRLPIMDFRIWLAAAVVMNKEEKPARHLYMFGNPDEIHAQWTYLFHQWRNKAITMRAADEALIEGRLLAIGAARAQLAGDASAEDAALSALLRRDAVAGVYNRTAGVRQGGSSLAAFSYPALLELAERHWQRFRIKEFRQAHEDRSTWIDIVYCEDGETDILLAFSDYVLLKDGTRTRERWDE